VGMDEGVVVGVDEGINVAVGMGVLVGVFVGVEVGVIVGLGVKDGSRQSGAESLCPLGSRVEPNWSYIFT